MERIKVNFVNFWDGFDKENNFFSNILRTKYQVEVSEDPDYLFASILGKNMDALKYKNAIRILYTGENIVPDFNIVDYAIGFCNLNFGDRYIRYPLYRMYGNHWESAKCKHNIPREEYERKHIGFCNFVYSNSDNVMPERDQILDLIDSYNKVDCGGKHRNNIGKLVQDKLEFCSRYKFTIAVENTSTPGYTTEKLIDAWAAGTIPIYYGNPEIGKEFNTKAFVNCHDYNSLEEVLDVVKKLDQDADAYADMMKAPIFYPQYSESELDEMIKDFILHIVSQDKTAAFRRDRYGWGRLYEDRLVKMYKLKNNKIIERLYKCYRMGIKIMGYKNKNNNNRQ